MKKETFQIEDMSCASCVAKIEKKLRSIDGVQEAIINFAISTRVFMSNFFTCP